MPGVLWRAVREAPSRGCPRDAVTLVDQYRTTYGKREQRSCGSVDDVTIYAHKGAASGQVRCPH